MKETIIVMGPESCGNRITAEICCRLTGLPLLPHTVVGDAMIETIRANGPHVVVRSLPHGGFGSPEGREFPSPIKLLNDLLSIGHECRFVIPIRDRSISTASKCRLHTRDCGGRELAEGEQDKAAWMIGLALACFPGRVLLWSYETLVWLEKTYIWLLADWLGATDRFNQLDSLEITNGNAKYLKGTP